MTPEASKEVFERFVRSVRADALASEPVEAWSDLRTISADETAIVGRDGWLFLYRGTNDYFPAYKRDEKVVSDADAWVSAIEMWTTFCRELGVPLTTVIVPNKASILPDKYPLELPQPITPRLESILAKLGSRSVIPIELMRNPALRETLFRRNDSHLSEAGSLLVSASILRALEPTYDWFADVGEPTQRRIEHPGDLGSKFDVKRSERLTRIVRDLDHVSVEKLRDPAPNHGLVGTSYETRNERAPIRKRLLVFGNSFFEKVPSWGMSPDFALTFETMRFVWSASVDVELVRSFRPDHVVFQTCERFLSRRPVMG